MSSYVNEAFIERDIYICKNIDLIIQEWIVQNKFIDNNNKSIWFVIWASECAR